jgi:hypothetical protein
MRRILACGPRSATWCRLPPGTACPRPPHTPTRPPAAPPLPRLPPPGGPDALGPFSAARCALFAAVSVHFLAAAQSSPSATLPIQRHLNLRPPLRTLDAFAPSDAGLTDREHDRQPHMAGVPRF